MRSTTSQGWWRAPWLVLLMLIVAFGLFSKESSIAVGVIVPLYWFIYEFPKFKKEQRLNRFMIEFCVWLVMVPPLIGMMAARHWVFKNSSPAETPFLDNPIRGIWQVQELGIPEFEQELKKKPMLGMSYIECKMTAVKIMGRLLLLLAWPWTLCSDYSYDEIPNFSWHLNRWADWQAVIALVAMLAIGAASYFLLKRGYKAAFFFIALFFIAAFPTSNLTVTIGSVMAERFMYLPLAGFTGIVAMLVFWGARKLWEYLKLDDPDDFPWHRVLAGSLLGLVVVIYGLRTYFRNPVWKEDETLWRDAIQHSKRSFRCYQSLAFAVYEKLPLAKTDEQKLEKVNEMISIASGALPIVDPLPNHLNSSRLYLHLGMYYSIKAELLCKKAPDGSLMMTPEAYACYEEAAKILERGSQIDRSFNQVNKAKQRLRGDPEWQITDAGLGPVYGTLGIAYARLGRFRDAYNRLLYMRQLDPTEIDAYLKLASVQVADNKFDEACASLMQCLLMDNQRQQVWGTLIQIYQQVYGQRASGAIVVDQGSGQVKLNPHHELVKWHLLIAYRDFIKTLRQSRRFAMAEEMGKMAKKQYEFPAETIDALFEEPVWVVTPEGVDYTQETKELRGYRPPATSPADK
jgi:tetratricopeptide (TPR) repeat protein